MVSEYPHNLATRHVYIACAHIVLLFQTLYVLKPKVCPQQICIFAKIQVFHLGSYILLIHS